MNKFLHFLKGGWGAAVGVAGAVAGIVASPDVANLIPAKYSVPIIAVSTAILTINNRLVPATTPPPPVAVP